MSYLKSGKIIREGGFFSTKSQDIIIKIVSNYKE